jgi:hypothetical protein
LWLAGLEGSQLPYKPFAISVINWTPGREMMMQEYRVYLLDSEGHITSRIDLACEDEEVARQRAKQLVDGHAVELWQGARLIGEFPVEHSG